jgi:hypothetical protein
MIPVAALYASRSRRAGFHRTVGLYDVRVKRSFVTLAFLVVGCAWLPTFPVELADERFAACGGDAEALAAFPLDASEYLEHIPAMGRAPELEAGGPAFAVVFGPDFVPATSGPGQPQPAAPGTRYVCVHAGDVANVYGPIDISGLAP